MIFLLWPSFVWDLLFLSEMELMMYISHWAAVHIMSDFIVNHMICNTHSSVWRQFIHHFSCRNRCIEECLPQYAYICIFALALHFLECACSEWNFIMLTDNISRRTFLDSILCFCWPKIISHWHLTDSTLLEPASI